MNPTHRIDTGDDSREWQHPNKNDLPKVLLLGLGAIGTIYAEKLSKTPDCDFRVLVDSKREKEYRRTGVFFNGIPLSLRYLTEEGQDFKSDLVLIATKGDSLQSAVELLPPFLSSSTILLPLLNGISAAGILRTRFPETTVLPGFFLGHASVRKGRSVEQDGVGCLYLGCRNLPDEQESLRKVAGLLGQAGIIHEEPSDFPFALWSKFILNVGINQTSAWFRADYGMIQRSPHMLAFAETLMKEARSVACAEGIERTELILPRAMHTILSMPPEVKTSMLQDVEGARTTEVDLFAGEICRLGKKHGIPTPLNQQVWQKFAV